MKDLSERAARLRPGKPSELPALSAVRRLVSARDRSSLELGALFRQLCETNSAVHERGQDYINQLESELGAARQAYSRFEELQRAPLVRIALRASRAFAKLGLHRL